jgi:hypothetical protein
MLTTSMRAQPVGIMISKAYILKIKTVDEHTLLPFAQVSLSFEIVFPLSLALLGGVGHCFAWHVRVRFGFCFHFNIEELVHSGLCAMQLGHNSIFNFARIKILL